MSKKIEFHGNKNTEKFYIIIFYLCYFIFTPLNYFKKNRFRINNVHDEEVLFLIRKWGENSSMNSELYESLKDYLQDSKKVTKLVLSNDEIIFNCLRDYIINHNPKHVVFDVRILITQPGILGVIFAIKSCFELNFLFKETNIQPICGMTDVIQPGQRLFTEIITKNNGIAVSWGSVCFHETRKFFHQRFVGPLFLPISYSTSKMFHEKYNSENNIKYDICTVGANYEPRTSLLNNLTELLSRTNYTKNFDFSKSLSYIDYLGCYFNSKIGINTNWVGYTFPNRLHLTHRNFEILFARALLMSQKCDSMDVYFVEGQDYVNYNDVEDLFKKILYYLNNEDERIRISSNGKMKVEELFKSGYVWDQIDKKLTLNNIINLKK